LIHNLQQRRLLRKPSNVASESSPSRSSDPELLQGTSPQGACRQTSRRRRRSAARSRGPQRQLGLAESGALRYGSGRALRQRSTRYSRVVMHPLRVGHDAQPVCGRASRLVQSGSRLRARRSAGRPVIVGRGRLRSAHSRHTIRDQPVASGGETGSRADPNAASTRPLRRADSTSGPRSNRGHPHDEAAELIATPIACAKRFGGPGVGRPPTGGDDDTRGQLADGLSEGPVRHGRTRRRSGSEATERRGRGPGSSIRRPRRRCARQSR